MWRGIHPGLQVQQQQQQQWTEACKALLLPQPAGWHLHSEGQTHHADAHLWLEALLSSCTKVGMQGHKDCALDKFWLQASSAAAGQFRATLRLLSRPAHLSVLAILAAPTPGLSYDRQWLTSG